MEYKVIHIYSINSMNLYNFSPYSKSNIKRKLEKAEKHVFEITNSGLSL